MCMPINFADVQQHSPCGAGCNRTGVRVLQERSGIAPPPARLPTILASATAALLAACLEVNFAYCCAAAADPARQSSMASRAARIAGQPPYWAIEYFPNFLTANADCLQRPAANLGNVGVLVVPGGTLHALKRTRVCRTRDLSDSRLRRSCSPASSDGASSAGRAFSNAPGCLHKCVSGVVHRLFAGDRRRPQLV